MIPPNRHDEPPAESSPTVSGAAIVRGAGWETAGNFLSQVSWFGSLLVLAALLPPRDFGVVAAGMAVVHVAMLLMNSGTTGAIVSGPEPARSELRTIALYNVSSGLALAVALAALAGPLVSTFAEGGNRGALAVLFLAIFFNGFSIVPQALLQKRMEFRRRAAISIASSTTSSLVSIVAVLAGAGVYALVLRIVLNVASRAGLSWIAARDLLPASTGHPPRPVREFFRRHGARWFLLLAATDLAAWSGDTLIVGVLTDGTQLGLYSLAFTLALAPLMQFSWQVGRVVFAASSVTTEIEVVARRMLRAVRLTGVVFVPLVPAAWVLAPVIVPALLGREWSGMVGAFQLLLVAGVIHGLINMVGEPLSGTGHIAFRAKINIFWSAGTLALVAALVPPFGIRGAAAAHLVAAIPLAAAYWFAGARRLEIPATSVWASVRSVAGAVTLQVLVTSIVLVLVRETAATDGAAAVAAALAGLAAAALVLVSVPSSPLADVRTLAARVVRRSSA